MAIVVLNVTVSQPSQMDDAFMNDAKKKQRRQQEQKLLQPR